MPTPRVVAAIAKAFELRDFAASQLPNTFDRSAESLLSVGLFDLAHEHMTTIFELLLEGRRIGSALALARPMAEACYRLHYLVVHQGDKLAEDIYDGNTKFPTLGPTVDDVEGHYALLGVPNVFNLIKPNLPFLNELTHGGRQQILSRYTSEGVLGGGYREQPIVDVVRNVISYYMIAAMALSQVLCERLGIPADGATAIRERLLESAEI